MHYAVFDDGGAQDDAAIHAAVGAEIADAACVSAARFAFEFGDDFARAHLWRAADGAGGEASKQCIKRVFFRGQATNHV